MPWLYSVLCVVYLNPMYATCVQRRAPSVQLSGGYTRLRSTRNDVRVSLSSHMSGSDVTNKAARSLACERCRSRKTKVNTQRVSDLTWQCTHDKPACALCAKAGADCVYASNKTDDVNALRA